MPAQATFKRVVRLLLGAFKQQQPEVPLRKSPDTFS
jgi:hypothetical protein